MTPIYDDVLVRLAIDALAIGVLAYGIYYRRHGRRDLVVIYSMFNIGLFLALIVIMSGDISVAVGFGLFAVLSIVRLRSEPFTNGELAYFFLALVIGLVTGIDVGSIGLTITLSALALSAAAVIDHPRLLRQTRQLQITLETIPSDPDALRRHVEERLNARVYECYVLEIDYVRETTRASVRCATTPLTQPTTGSHAPFARTAG